MILLAILATLTTPCVLATPVGAVELWAWMCGYLLGTIATMRVATRGISPNLAEYEVERLTARNRQADKCAQAWIVVGAAILSAIGWQTRCEQWADAAHVFWLRHLLTLAPLLSAVAIYYAMLYPFHRFMRMRLVDQFASQGRRTPPCWSRNQYLLFAFRHNVLIIVLPLLLLFGAIDAIYLWIWPWLTEANVWGALADALSRIGIVCSDQVVSDVGTVALILLTAGVVMLLAPLLIVHLWKTRPLPPGPIRDRLDTLARKGGVRYRNIRIWYSDGVIANAAAIGLIPPLRHILLTDALLEQMSDDHIEAIFAHELAHAKQHHLVYCALFAITSGLLTSAAAWGIASLLPGATDLEEMLPPVLLVAMWIFGFGAISRRFERQADIHAAWLIDGDDATDLHISARGAGVFCESLCLLARLNGMRLGGKNWRHGSLSDRIAHLRELSAGGSRRTIDRQVRWIRWGLSAGFMLGIGLLVLRMVA